MTDQKHFDVIVAGGGAAGLMCAIEASKRGREVLIIEKSEKIGKKILISGGGRCNFTNKVVSSNNFISANPHFCKSALSRFTPADFISLVEKHNISYHEKKLGQLFCDSSSRSIVAMLENECMKHNAAIITHCNTNLISKDTKFILETTRGEFSCDSLVISSGGVSIPKMGATGFGYEVAKQFGLKLKDIRPALVPLTLNENDLSKFGDLSGISIDSIVSCNGISFRENLLFTHKGLSGPAVLQISSYRKGNEPITINLLPGIDLFKLLTKESNIKSELSNFVSGLLPKRFADTFTKYITGSKPVNQYSHAQLKRISDTFHNWELFPSGSEGFSKAEVTLGGVDTNELSSKTMESKKVKGLYFIGEVVDVTGWLGGYNFQWAWSSGFAAGQYV